MPRSSRHKSHKQSKHSSRDAREHSDSEEDVKMKDRNGKEEGSVRVSRDSGSSEKRKLSSSEDPSGHGNGDASGEYIASKRRKEKAEVLDRWNGGGDERGDGEAVERENKGESSRAETDKGSKSKVSTDSKSKSGRKYDVGNEKKEDNVGLAAEKEENKSSSKMDSKRKSEKDYGQKEVQQSKVSKESKDKDRGLEKERKVQDIKRDTDVRAVDGEATRKQGSRSGDFGEERQGKRVRENTEWPIQDELRNPELEKELEKRIRKRRDGSSDKYQDLGKESEDRKASSRVERAKDGKYKDGSYGDKHRDEGDKDTRHRDDKYQEDAIAERSSMHKYKEDGDRDDRRREDKYREDGEKDRRRDNKYREDGDRDDRHRDDKYREDSDRDHKHRDEKYHRDDSRDDRHREDKYHEDGDRDDRHKDDRYAEDGNRDGRNREEKNWDAVGRDSRHKDGKQRDDGDRDKRLRDVKYREERSSRDRASDKSDTRRLRDETGGAETYFRKTSNCDGSPIYDDRSTRFKEDKGRRRASDKEDHGDMRTHSTKERHAEVDKKYTGSGRLEAASDRGRSNSRNADAEIIPNHSRQRSSPSSGSHVGKDHYRVSRQEESKYGDFAHEERVRLNLNSSKDFVGVAGGSEKTSVNRTIDSPVQIADNYVEELSTERRLKSDVRSSPLQMLDKSPSSMSLDRKHLNRSDVRRSLDVEDSGQRSGGSKDAKDYSGREGRGSRELPMETNPGDELSQADGDTLSVSSPFTRTTSHLSGNSRSLLPPPPFRSGAESPLVFGSLEEENRGKSNNRYRRMNDPNMGRLQGSPWRGVPNWPSPVANGFMPFQHGPPPMGFHPMMQQFPAPPMFGVRPSMELNQAGVPYPLPDSDRFSGHGRSLGWRTPVDEGLMHGWDPNNAVFGDESHMYGRLDWDHNNRTLSSDGRKGHSRGASMELASVHKKEDLSGQGTPDDAGASQSGLQTGSEQKVSSAQVERMADVDQPSDDALESDTVKASKPVPVEREDVSRKDAAWLSRIYLSKLDISEDLTQPELYNQCMSLMDMDQNTDSEEADFKFLFVEEAIETAEKISNKISSVSILSTMNESIFEKAMSLYNKQRTVVNTKSGDKVPFANVDNSVPVPDEEIAGANGDKAQVIMGCDPEAEGAAKAEVIVGCDDPEAEGAAKSVNEVNVEVSLAINKEIDDEPVLAEKVEIGDPNGALKEEKADLLPQLKQETPDSVAENKSPSPENLEQSLAQSPSKNEVVNGAGESKDNNLGPLIFSDVSSEAVMPESGSVNLSRIHQSPESTR